MVKPHQIEDVTSSHPIFTQRRPSFFRYYCPDHNSMKMSIPTEFIKNVCIQEKVTLKSLWGKVWSVKLEHVDGTVYLTQGWRSYIKDNSLERGDFLTFKYMQGSCFYVIIYGKDGCMKVDPIDESFGTSQCAHMADTSSSDVAMDEGTYVDLGSTDDESEDGDGEVDLRFCKTFKTGFKNFVIVPKNIGEACVLKLPQSIRLRSEKGFGIMTQLRETSDKVVVGYAGILQFLRDNDVKIGDTLEFQVILGSGRVIKEIIMRNQSN